MDLVRTVGQAERALVGVHAGELEDLADAARAMQLQATIDHLGGDVGHRHLDHGDLLAGFLVAGLSIAHAAFSTSRRAMSISMRMSATWALVTPISEMR